MIRQCRLFLEAVLIICSTTFPLTMRLLNMRHFSNHHCSKALLHQTPLSCLTLSVAQLLGIDEMRRYFKMGSTATKFDLCDAVKKEFR